MSGVMQANIADRPELRGATGRAVALTAWRAMAWKELRENGKWALLALIGISAAMVWALGRHGNNWQSLTSSEFLAVTCAGMPAVGLALGLLQILPERRRDQWAFLVHRPATPTLLFVAKCSVGLSLCALATGLPLLCAALWAAAPGHVAAPFEWPMALPGVADLITGIAYYFAGMLIGLRQARWYATRIMPVGLAVVCSMLVVVACREFWQAIIVAGVGIAVCGVAAWASFRAGGTYARQPRVAKATLVVSLFVGLSLCLMLGLALIFTAFFDRRVYTQSRYSSYELDREGSVVRVTKIGSRIESITDLQGMPIEKYRGITLDSELSQMTAGKQSAAVSITPPEQESQLATGRRDGYRATDRFYFMPDIRSQGEEVWFYLRREGEFVGYDPITANRIGAIGPDGFVPGAADTPRRFTEPLQDERYSNYAEMPLLVFPSAIYRPDLKHHRLELLFAAPPGERIGGATDGERSQFGLNFSSNREAAPFALVATSKALYVLPSGRKSAVSIPLAYPPSVYADFTVSVVPDKEGYFIWYTAGWWVTGRPNLPEHVVHVASDGHVLTQTDLAPIKQEISPGPTVEPQSLLSAACFPLELVGLVILQFRALHPDVSLSAAFAERQSLIVTSAALLSAVVWALVTYLIVRRRLFGRGRRLGWSLGTLILGPVALLTFLSLQSRPACVTCPSCGKRRRVSQPACEHCSAPFPRPTIDGTEIFEG